MNLHDFQAKAILARHGIPVPAGQVAWTPDEVTRVAADLGGSRFAVKAQILAGGRGEAGGVKLADSFDQVRGVAAEMLGSRLIRAQTPSAGHNARRVYVEQAVACAREIYVGLLVDRNEGCVVLLGAGQGGEEVEKLLRRDPKSLVRLALPGTQQPGDAAFRQFAEALGLTGSLVEEAAGLLAVLARAFVELDASLIEVNPLCITEEGRLVALDVKMVVDDNALFRQPDIQSLRDEDEVDALELEAQRHDLNFFRMDGNIGVVVNGAGLALATHDILRNLGGAPANFMDIRTTAMSLQIAKGIGLLLADPAVKVILVNVHGGAMTGCDMIVEAIHIAMRWSGRKIPIVFRAAGQNAEYARRLIVDRRIAHEVALSMSGAACRGAREGLRPMAILVDRDTRLIAQGMTGTFYTDQAMEYGTRVVAGIRPGKGGSRHFSLSRLRSCGGGDARNGRQCKPRLRAGASGRRRDHRGRRRCRW